ncbi:hypothetical protein [Catenulispora rubra]|uniref:hypothetical protein n=1 Tax=Catenulispora rubra TaxID=280293 RepID=UPI0018921D43|nr:hypothetical protein [Catenulispora rubra]
MTFRPARRDSVVALAGVLAGAAVATAIAVAAWPGSAQTAQGSSKAASATATGPTLAPDPVNETLRPKEVVLPSEGPYTSGKIVLVPLRLTCGLSTIIGTHGEEQANGQYCMIRVALTDDDTFTHTFDVRKTALTTTAGASIPVAYEAQEVERQPLQLPEVGRSDRYEFDIYYDVPRDATVNGFTFDDGEGGATARAPLPVRSWPFS